MSEHDRQIDEVLNAFRQAEPRPGLEARVLATLRTAESTHAGAFSWPFLTLRPGSPLPWIVAVALLAAAGGSLLLHRGKQAAGRPGERLEATATSQPRLQRETWGVPVAPVLKAERVPHISLLRHGPESPRTFRENTPQTAGDSLPPPPLPLTEQERLMLRLVRREPLQQLAELSKPAQDAALQHGKESVTEFFAPPPPLQQESSEDTSAAGQQ